MKNLLKSLFFLFICNSVLSCNKIVIESTPEDENAPQQGEEGTPGPGLMGRGDLEKSLMKFFKDCIKHNLFKKAEFAGLSNSILVGDQLTKDNDRGLRLYESLSEVEYSDLLIKGNEAKCSKASSSQKELMANLSLEFIKVSNPALKASLAWNDSIVINDIEFVNETLNNDKLRMLLESDEEKMKNYRKFSLEKGRKIITQITKCRNVNFSVYTNRTVNDSLAVSLAKGALFDSTKIGGATAKIQFKKNESNVITGRIENEVVLFYGTAKVSKTFF